MTAPRYARGLALSLLVLVLSAIPAQAAPTDPLGARNHVETLGRDALASLRSPALSPADREIALAALLQQGVAVDLIGRFALGRHWKSATPAERVAYRELFRAFMVRSYAGYLKGLAGTSFEILQTAAVGERDVMVATRITRPKGNPVQAGWRVREIEGRYKIVDVVVAGVSLAAAQRQDFYTVVGRQGIGGLLENLRAKIQTASR